MTDLTTPRPRLRQWRAADLEHLAALNADPAAQEPGRYRSYPAALRAGTPASLERDEPQFRLDPGDQYEVSIAMQKRHLTVDSVHGDQAISGGSWRYASPSAPGVEVSRGTRSRPGVGLHQHGQFAEYPIPARKPFGTVSPLQYLLQNGWSQPHRVRPHERLDQLVDLSRRVAAQKGNPNRRVDEHRPSSAAGSPPWGRTLLRRRLSRAAQARRNSRGCERNARARGERLHAWSSRWRGA